MDTELATQSHGIFKIPQKDILAELLRDKRSPETRRAYANDLKDFFLVAASTEPSPAAVAEFLKLERTEAIALVLDYKNSLIERGLAEATVNRRLAAIKSLVRYASDRGYCAWSLEAISGEKVIGYRDTRGVDIDSYRAILETCDRATVSGKRDYAILRLLWDNALRRGEISKANLGDFDPSDRRLRIHGKGRGTQSELVDLSEGTVEAIAQWVAVRGSAGKIEPLFVALDRASRGKRFSGNAIYEMVKGAAIAAGIQKRFSPHRCRHSSITAALEATGGDIRRVQKLSRHAKPETLMIYDDARQGQQGQISDLLSELVQKIPPGCGLEGDV